MINNIYMISGTDDYQIENFKNNILNKINNDSKNEVISFNLIESDFNNIFNHFWTISLFSQKRIFIVDYINLIFKKDNKNIDYLLKLLDNNNFFIFIYRDDKVIKNTKFIFFLKKIINYNTKKIDNNLVETFILSYLKNQKAKITNEALNFMIYNLPSSLSIVENELNKIININKNIDLEILENNLTKYLIGDIFKFINSIFKKDLNEFHKNYLYIKTLTNIENYVIALIFDNIRIIKMIKSLKNTNDDEIIKILNLHPYRFKILKSYSDSYNFSQLNEILNLIYNYDINKIKIRWLNNYFHFILLKIYRTGEKFENRQII